MYLTFSCCFYFYVVSAFALPSTQSFDLKSTHCRQKKMKLWKEK